MKIRAPAKVSLSLRVVGKRRDGYHLIDTIMMPVSLYDEIEIKRAKPGAGIGIECDDPKIPSEIQPRLQGGGVDSGQRRGAPACDLAEEIKPIFIELGELAVDEEFLIRIPGADKSGVSLWREHVAQLLPDAIRAHPRFR